MTRPELTPRQRQVLALIAAGHTNSEIAAQLHISLDTVKTTAANLYGRLGVRGRVQAVTAATRLGLIAPGPEPVRYQPGPTYVAEPAAASPRQIAHWVKAGWLRPHRDRTTRTHTWPPAEVEVAQLMARLVEAGLTPEAAHRVARGGQLAPGITITVADEAPVDEAADVEDGAA